MKLNQNTTGDVSFDISGSDMDSNQARRTIEFSVSRPVNSSSTSSLSFSALSIQFPGGSITKSAPVYVFPPSPKDDDINTAATAIGMASKAVTGTSQEKASELIDIEYVADIQAPHLGLNGMVTFRVPIPENLPVPPTSPQIGIYGRINNDWVFIGNRNDGTAIEADTTRFCEIKLAADLIGPAIEMLSHQEGETLEYSRAPVLVRVADFGSGVDESSIRFTVDGAEVDFEYDKILSRATWKPERDIEAGDHKNCCHRQ